MSFKTVSSYLLDLLFVPKCAGCGERLSPMPKGCLCTSCYLIYEMERDKECAKCQRPLSECSCSTENLEKAKIFRLSKLTVYRPASNDYVINKMIFKLKKRAEYHTVEFLAKELARNISEVINPKDDYIITYAPRSKRAISRYGHDHMEILARKTAKILDLQFARLLKRDSDVEQKTLSYSERIRSIRLSYENKDNVDIKGKNLILMDDIVTSGATLSTGARTLRKNGARTVACSVISVSRSAYIKYRIIKKH
ncbi:MAG: ComF family protein [Clostridia bacterium]|nr:ComF family protein [Clostridia bacterium]MBQ5800351.1 ComF family protein [Clostridia bacterium]